MKGFNTIFCFSAGSRCASPCPSQPPISREQALLESFFHTLTQFAFDKAKDQVVSCNFELYEFQISSDEDDRRIFLGSKFSILGVFLGGLYWEAFFCVLNDLDMDVFGY